MNLLDLVEKHVPMRKVGTEWHGPCPHCGTSHRDPSKSDRFVVKTDGQWFCRNCGHGDAIEFLRRFEGATCPEAHAALGKDCTSTTCPVLHKCRKGQSPTPRRDDHQRTTPTPATTTPAWIPAAATTPHQQWQQNAAVLVQWAHQRLLKEPEQLQYLQQRGLPLQAVQRYHLGWWPQTKFLPLDQWGLPADKNPETGRPRKLWVPRGIVIPTFSGDTVQRIRIRRHPDDTADGRGKYIAIKGSSDDVPVHGPEQKAYVIVESDLDGLLIHHLAGDLVGAIPLASCSVKPRTTAGEKLRQADTILVALDHEPRTNPATQKHENPGGKAAGWWLQHYPQAERWPVPAGKDPGEYHQQGGDIRAWILAGLPPIYHVQPAPAPIQPAPAAESQPKPETADIPHLLGISQHGIPYCIAHTAADQQQLLQQHPDHAHLLRSELKHLQEHTPEEAHSILLTKLAFPGAHIVRTRTGNIPQPAQQTDEQYDPSRARAAHRTRRNQ